MRHFRCSLPVLLLCLGVLSPAQNAPASATPATTQVILGNATIALTGPWKFHIGDNVAWASPTFDDSAWGAMDLTPPPGSYDPLIGSSGYVPGWTAHGYKGYSGYAWYRLRLNIQNGQTALALKMPDNFDDAYQIYVNGQWIGQFGRFTAHGVIAYTSLPRAFPLPTNLRSGFAIIAIRMWMGAFTPLVDQDAGGLHGPPVLGQATAIGSLLDLDWYAINRSLYGEFLEMAILLLALLVAFGLFWLDRKEPAFLWLGLTCAVMMARSGFIVMGNYTAWIDGNLLFLIEDAVFTPLTIGLWVVFWAYWFRLNRMARWHRMVWSLVVLLGIGMALLRAPFYGTAVPVQAIVWLQPLTLTLKLVLGVLLVWIMVRGIQKDKTEGWLALLPIVLVILSQYQEELLVLHLPTSYFPFGMAISLTAVATVLSLTIITVLLLRRFLHGQREREQWKLEIEQAKQVQQVLVPEALPVVPGLSLESEYRPAQQVGGDFFQIIAHPSDGSVLIVVGDVTGKGLKAGMLVALIVGAIRTATDTTFDPLYVLRTLNQRLLGRGHAHATCLVLRIEANGAVTLANAGHLPPYLNGSELTVQGALPLGMIENTEFSVMRFQLAPGDALMLLSDGIAEAQDEHGHLFGFERIRDLLQKPVTAAQVAAAAQKFGQQDDISVLRIVRSAAITAPAEPEPALAVG
ncbi:MAG: SpoIIE family protein phosphatase [Acidobacteriaceae bacterium]